MKNMQIYIIDLAEYQRRFPTRRVRDERVFLNTHRRLRETGNTSYRREHNIMRAENVELDERILNAVRAQPSISTRRLAYQSHTSQRQVLRVLNGENLYHSTPVQGLLPEDFPQ